MTLELLIDQPALAGMCLISDAVEKLAHGSGVDERGAIFTRREVVDFMLDLAGYTADKPLHRLRLLEPSFGGGEFALAAIERLMSASIAAGALDDLAPCIRAVELHTETFIATRERVRGFLIRAGLAANEANRLLSAWLLHGDFLLAPLDGPFDFVVGNPPYVRQELIPSALLAEYRRRYATLYDRADLYVPFIERSLSSLKPGGQMAFICADRWTKNKYGGPLRAMVAKDFHLRAFVDMVDTPAFESEVSAYPAITLIERGHAGPTLVAERPDISPKLLALLATGLRGENLVSHPDIRRLEQVVSGDEPWVFSSSGKLALLRRLEARFPTLEEAGCKVGIGVATGADRAFIAPFDELDVEPSRKVKLATTKDITSGSVEWRGLGVVNPFEDDGSLVELAKYPRLRAHLEKHREAITDRHVAKKAPANWYRTIDRITPSIASVPKLLIPDIKGSAQAVYEDGQLYPHHNLYYVVSSEWDLHALQAVLLSSVARQFVQAYSTAMRGGFLRFQAQYLRRIRLPRWVEVSKSMRLRLVNAAKSLDQAACDDAVAELYGLTVEEFALLVDGQQTIQKRELHVA